MAELSKRISLLMIRGWGNQQRAGIINKSCDSSMKLFAIKSHNRISKTIIMRTI